MHGRGMFADAFESHGVRVHCLSKQKIPPAFLTNLPRLIRHGHFDIVQCHLFGANWIGKPIARVLGVPVIYSHDQCNDAFRSDSRWVTRLDSLVNQLSTRIFSVSESVSQFLIEREGIDPERVVYLPNSVDTEEFFPPSDAVRRAARKKLGLPESGVLVGAVGRLNPQKRFEDFVSIAERVLAREHTREIHFVLFGSGPEENRLRALAAPLGDRFIFAGTHADRPAIYHALDGQVLTSGFEGMPLTMLEGMASGLPVAASRVDGVVEVVGNDACALLFDPGDVASAVDAVVEMLGSPEKSRHLGRSARARVEAHYDARRLSGRMHGIYEDDVKRRSSWPHRFESGGKFARWRNMMGRSRNAFPYRSP